ncbi:MAG: PilZ domain-containing protein [Rhodanobacteraceae bacterium]
MIVIEDKHSRDYAEGPVGLRHARMKRHTAVLMIRRDEAWTAELEDISATGVMLSRPDGWRGEPGDLWVLDMLFGVDLNIHLEARVARLSGGRIGMEFARIPEDKQAPLWNLLGGYADTLEPWGSLRDQLMP